MTTNEARGVHLLSSLNYKEGYELKLLEAVKILMLISAIKLHKSISCEEHVPIFAIMLFARDTSPDARQFMKRHLNAVGVTGGLEQVSYGLWRITLSIIPHFWFGNQATTLYTTFIINKPKHWTCTLKKNKTSKQSIDICDLFSGWNVSAWVRFGNHHQGSKTFSFWKTRLHSILPWHASSNTSGYLGCRRW